MEEYTHDFVTTDKHQTMKEGQKLTWVENAGCHFLNLEDAVEGNNIAISNGIVQKWVLDGWIK